MVSFDSPVFITGGQSANFTTPYLGVVTKLAGGSLGIDFDCLLCNSQRHFEFSNDNYTGSFDLALGDVVLDVGGTFNPEPRTDTEDLIGHITNATQTAVPEPASLAMLGSGLLFGFGAVRKRCGR